MKTENWEPALRRTVETEFNQKGFLVEILRIYPTHEICGNHLIPLKNITALINGKLIQAHGQEIADVLDDIYTKLIQIVKKMKDEG